MQIRLDVRFCPLAAAGATSTHDGLWRAISDPSSTGSGMRLSKWSNGKGGFDQQYQLAGAGGIEPPNGGIKIRCLTAWLRPNRPGRNTGSISATASGTAGL